MGLARRAADDAESSGARDALARAYSVLDRAYQSLGEPRKAVFEKRAVEIFREIGELRSAAILEMNLGMQAYAEGRWTRPSSAMRAPERELRRIGDAANAAFVRANIGEILISRREFDHARSVLDEARTTLRGLGFAAPAIFADIRLGRLTLEAGDPGEGERLLRAIVDEARDLQHPFLVADASIYLATAYRKRGEPQHALEALEIDAIGGDEVLELGAKIDLARAAALADLGNVGDAAIALDGALALARDQSKLYELAQILLARAELARQAGVQPDEGELEEAHRLLQLFGA